jgi:hypothetical protein
MARPGDRRIRARRRRNGRGALIGTGIAVAALAVGPFTNFVVPGLLLASPIIAAGIIALRRTTGDAAFMLWVAAVFALAVIATQYDRGGTLEWGGRYFAIAVPVAMAPLLSGLRSMGERLEPRTRVAGGTAIVVLSGALAFSGLSAIRNVHAYAGRVLAAADEAGTRSDAGGGDPVVITRDNDVGRFTWPASTRQRWLWVPPDDTAPVIEALAADGVQSVVIATQDPDSDADLLGEAPGEPIARAGAWRFYVVAIPGASNMRS